MKNKILGVVFNEDGNFVGACCLGDEDRALLDDEDAVLPIVDEDHWFGGELCFRCGNLVERKKESA